MQKHKTQRINEQKDRTDENHNRSVRRLKSTDYLENIKQGAMNLLGNHLLNFGNTLTMAVKSDSNLKVHQTPRSGEIDKDEVEEDDGHDRLL